MSGRKVFGNLFAPVENDFHEAVSKAILALQYKCGISQTSLAQRIGVDRGTIYHAQEKHHGLSGWAVFRMIFEFAEEAPEAIAPILALCGPCALPVPDDGKQAIAIREAMKILEAAGAGDGE